MLTTTGAPRAREAAAQTHSCCGILTAGAQARRCKNLGEQPRRSLRLRERKRGYENWPSAIRSRECAPSAPCAREAAEQTHRCGGVSGYGSAGAEMKKMALCNPITGVPRAREAAEQTHRCRGIYIGSRKAVEVWIVRGPLVLRQASWAKEP